MDQIERMTLIESMRKRPGMYVGSTDARGLHHLLCELIDNAMDACLMGTGGTILVDLQPDGGIRVTCDAIMHPFSTARDVSQSLHDAFLRIYDLEQGQKKDSVSVLNRNAWGWEWCLLNALSRSLSIEIHRRGHRWHQEFHNQKPGNSTNDLDGSMETATLVTFYPDETLFEDTQIHWTPLSQYLSQSSYLLPDLAFRLSDQRPFPTRLSHFPKTRGIGQYVGDLIKDLSPLGRPIVISDSHGQTTIPIAFQYSGEGSQILSFVNNRQTVGHGSHVAGFLDALQRVLRKVSRQNGASENEAFPLERIMTHLTAVVSIWTPKPLFAGCTRSKLHSPEVRRSVYEATWKGLQSSFAAHPHEAQRLLAHLPPSRRPSRKAQIAVPLR